MYFRGTVEAGSGLGHLFTLNVREQSGDLLYWYDARLWLLIGDFDFILPCVRLFHLESIPFAKP